MIFGKNKYTAIKIEFIAANKTDAAAQSLDIFANLLYFLPTTISTKDSIDVLSNSRIRTEIIVEIRIRNS